MLLNELVQGQYSDRQQCLLQTRNSAGGSGTAQCRADNSFPNSKWGLDVVWHGDASFGQCRSQKVQGLGGTLLQNNEKKQERQLGDTSSVHEAYEGCPGQHLHKERNPAFSHQSSATVVLKWARVAVNLQCTKGECFPLKALLLCRDQEWWERTQADEGMRKRNHKATRKYRHGTNVPMRRLEALFVEVFGVNWKRMAMAEDGTQWCQSRWGFVNTILKNHKFRLTSLPANNKEPEAKEERLASGGKEAEKTQAKATQQRKAKQG